MKIFISLKMLVALFCLAFCLAHSQAQDTLHKRIIYKSSASEANDSITEQITRDSAVCDSIRHARHIQDSLIARATFVRDSLLRRQEILDSLNIVKKSVQDLLEAYYLTSSEEIVSGFETVKIVGDSALSDFVYHTLPFGVKDPYLPWKISIPLTGKQVRIIIDKQKSGRVFIQLPRMKASFYQFANMMIIQRQPYVQNSSTGSYYKIPLDTVFYDNNNMIISIKSYVLFHSIINNNQQGNHLFTNRICIKQYEYDATGEMSKYELIRFCDRLKAYESNKVCSKITYYLSHQGNTLLLTRKNNPANSYSDGTFTFILDAGNNIQSISFANEARTEKWQRTIELNKDGLVNCYFDKTNEVIRQSSCMVYHNEPGAKYPVEIITTIFEKDGISYFQRNNTTGNIRTRDKMTLEWTPWHYEN